MLREAFIIIVIIIIIIIVSHSYLWRKEPLKLTLSYSPHTICSLWSRTSTSSWLQTSVEAVAYCIAFTLVRKGRRTIDTMVQYEETGNFQEKNTTGAATQSCFSESILAYLFFYFIYFIYYPPTGNNKMIYLMCSLSDGEPCSLIHER